VEGAAEGEPADDAPARDAQDADAPVDQDAPPVPRPGVAAANLAQRLVHDLAADLDRDVLGTQPTLPEAG
jgi:hypothetical protein